MKLLLVTLYFPPAGGGGVQRPLKFASHLPALGIETHVLAPDDPKWVHEDAELPLPTQAWVHRARYVGPSGRRIADELHGRSGVDLMLRRSSTIGRRLLLPDENVTWNATAIPKAISIVRSEGIDVVLTTSPPSSVHLIGAAVKRATGVKWVADLRDSIALHAHRSADGLGARAKQKARAGVAHLVARQADAIVTAAEAITEETRGISPVGPLVTITNGCDFDDFAGLEYARGDRFRAHARRLVLRQARPEAVPARARGVGSRRRDGPVPRRLPPGRPGVHGGASGSPTGSSSSRTSRAASRFACNASPTSLLLLIPEADGRGRGVLSGKVFEYIAAERPILAVVPPDGAAAKLVEDTGAGVVAASDDVDAIRQALLDLHARWQRGELDAAPLSGEWRDRLSRAARVEELADLLKSL